VSTISPVPAAAEITQACEGEALAPAQTEPIAALVASLQIAQVTQSRARREISSEELNVKATEALKEYPTRTEITKVTNKDTRAHLTKVRALLEKIQRQVKTSTPSQRQAFATELYELSKQAPFDTLIVLHKDNAPGPGSHCNFCGALDGE
jgi:hypothetical protein